MKAVKANVKFEKKALLIQFQLFISYKPACLQNNVIFTDEHYLSGYFPWTALWADSVSPRTNTIESRDHFKTMRIGENLVVNCNKI